MHKFEVGRPTLRRRWLRLTLRICCLTLGAQIDFVTEAMLFGALTARGEVSVLYILFLCTYGVITYGAAILRLENKACHANFAIALFQSVTNYVQHPLKRFSGALGGARETYQMCFTLLQEHVNYRGQYQKL